MGLRINTNLPALLTQRNLRATRSALDVNLERLSSGYRINHAHDDAAGLAISESLRSQIRGLGQAERNAQDGVSLIQIAEGGMAEISNILIRIRELGVQAASDTIGPQERQFIDVEFHQLLEEINRISNATEFNNLHLLNGQAEDLEIQVGTRNTPGIDRIKLFNSKSSNLTSAALGLNQTSMMDKVAAQNSLATIDLAFGKVTANRAEFGAVQNRLQSIINNILVSKENLSAANSRIRDADIAEETAELAKNQILIQSGISVLGQANSTIKSALNLLGQGGGG